MYYIMEGSMKYCLNVKTGTLHIKGFCCHTCPTPKEYLIFKTEEDAKNHMGLYIKNCKLCQNKKELRLQEAEKSEEI